MKNKIDIPFSSPIVVGVSGGVDSVTLSDMLYRQGVRDFALAHCNFHLRGEESDGDAEFVREWAESRGIVFHRADFDTGAYAEENGVSIEMAARELRYGWFALLCREHGYAAVAVAHNANDNAETLILNLVRGTGLRGICGMQSVSVQNVEASAALAAALDCSAGDFPESLTIWRPLLGMTRHQIEGYAFKHGLSWREDRTNSDTEYRRNLIRHEIIPLLERLNPSAVKVLNRDMAYFNAAQEVVDDWFDCRCSVPEDSAEAVSVDEARLLSCIGKRERGWKYALFLYLERFGFNSAVIGQVEDLLLSGRTVSGKKFFSPTHSLVMSGTSFVISPLGSEGGVWDLESCRGDGSSDLKGTVGKWSSDCCVEINGPGEYSVGERRFTVEVFDRPDDFELRQKEGVTAVDADKVEFPFVVRDWQNGDWMRPLGCHGRKKISDLFTDLKFSLPKKRQSLFLASAQTQANEEGQRPPQSARDSDSATSHVLALIGHRIDDSVRITPTTKHILRITLL